MLAELLALDPSATNRAAGIAAVRRVARVQPSGDTVVEQRPGSVTISWPGSPTIVAVAGGGFAGMVTSGGHSDVAERAWRLAGIAPIGPLDRQHLLGCTSTVELLDRLVASVQAAEEARSFGVQAGPDLDPPDDDT